MLQTLILIASIVMLAGAILTSSLVSARDAFHREVAAKTQTAMTDATEQFLAWARGNISANGTEQNWKGATNPTTISKSMCINATACRFYQTTRWIVTGATTGNSPQKGSNQSTSTAHNLATAVDEQRLSATVSVAVSDMTGHNIYGGRALEITARLFEAAPYIVVTGVRDLTSESGVSRSSEGDSGGVNDTTQNGKALATPSTIYPARYINTVIIASLNCENTLAFNEANPTATVDRGNGNIVQTRQGGSMAWSFQLPCTPTYGVPSAPSGTQDYNAPIGNAYQIEPSSKSSSWITNANLDLLPP